MTDEPAFTKAAQIPSAKVCCAACDDRALTDAIAQAKNKRPRDRGGKKRREAREQERLAAGLPLAGKPRTTAPARTDKPKIGKKAKQPPAFVSTTFIWCGRIDFVFSAATTTRAIATTKPAAKRRKHAADS